MTSAGCSPRARGAAYRRRRLRSREAPCCCHGVVEGARRRLWRWFAAAGRPTSSRRPLTGRAFALSRECGDGGGLTPVLLRRSPGTGFAPPIPRPAPTSPRLALRGRGAPIVSGHAECGVGPGGASPDRRCRTRGRGGPRSAPASVPPCGGSRGSRGAFRRPRPMRVRAPTPAERRTASVAEPARLDRGRAWARRFPARPAASRGVDALRPGAEPRRFGTPPPTSFETLPSPVGTGERFVVSRDGIAGAPSTTPESGRSSSSGRISTAPAMSGEGLGEHGAGDPEPDRCGSLRDRGKRRAHLSPAAPANDRRTGPGAPGRRVRRARAAGSCRAALSSRAAVPTPRAASPAPGGGSRSRPSARRSPRRR